MTNSTGRAYSIDKLDSRRRREVIRAILSGQPDTIISSRYGVPLACVQRYKTNKLFSAVAEAWAEERQDASRQILDRFDDVAERLRKVLDGIDRELSDGEGGYDLHDAMGAAPYVRMLNDTARTLMGCLSEIAKIEGLVKETAEVKNSPTLIVAQICQVITQCASKEDIVDRLRQIRADEGDA